MIYEYALEPEMVASWGSLHKRFFSREFGLGQGRVVSRYPKSWSKMVWDSFAGGSDMDKKRLEELLVRVNDTMVKRKESCWDNSMNGWLENALVEHDRYPFKAILARNNPANRPQIICEDELAAASCPQWDTPHGIVVNRKAPEMAAAIEMMLARCRWVKFIDPYFSQTKKGHKQSLSVFLDLLKRARAVGSPEIIEMHSSGNGATADFLNNFYEKIIPAGLQVTLFQWQEKPGGQKLHNRYILTDLGGVVFNHGLDTGADGETDDINRLDRDQYELRCSQYNSSSKVFEPVEKPLVIVGKR